MTFTSDTSRSTRLGRLATSIKRQRERGRERLRKLAARLRGSPDLAALQRAGLRLGSDVYVGVGAWLDPDFCFLISVGDRSTLSINVTVLAHDASTRHLIGWTRIAAVHVGSDVFIGAGAIILPGVTIGDGAVVAAASVVRHDVAAGVMVAGNPARPIGQVSDYASAHAVLAQSKPKWPRQGWTAGTGMTSERVEIIRQALAEHGEAYIK